MSTRELVRYRVLSLVLEGQLVLQDAAEKLGLSPRHACRLLRRLRQRGPAGLVHGNRGRPAANLFDDEHWEAFGGDILGRRALGSITFNW